MVIYNYIYIYICVCVYDIFHLWLIFVFMTVNLSDHIQVFLRKLRKAEGKKEEDRISHLKEKRPKYKLDHIVKERWFTKSFLFLSCIVFYNSAVYIVFTSSFVIIGCLTCFYKYEIGLFSNLFKLFYLHAANELQETTNAC